VIRQAEVPGRLFSSTGNGLAVVWDSAEVAGPGLAEPCCAVAVEVHAAVASVAAPARARAAAPRRARLIVTRLTEPHHRTASAVPAVLAIPAIPERRVPGNKTRLGVPLSPSLTGETRSLPCRLTRSA
jgi:hypothetical protein